MNKNFERMIQLATDTFAVHNNPQQLDVDEKIIAQLQLLHPSTVSEHANEDGPVSWVLLIPTTLLLMKEFLNQQIGETELLDRTIPGTSFECIYLCSAITLPEFRNQGLTKKMTINAIQQIQKDHSIQALFVWNFSKEGEYLSDTVSAAVQLPLHKRKR